jgi:uncharacterized protein YjbI with pentapeptide repeats
MPPKRLLGPSTRQPPQLDGELTECTGGGLDDFDDFDLIEDTAWTGGAPRSAAGIEIMRSRLSGVVFTGLELTDLRLVDVELVECELSGAVLAGARWERVVLCRCRLSGMVAAELKATDVRFDQCKADQAWLRGSVLDRCEVVDTDLSGADLYGAQVTRSAFRRCDLTELDVSTSRFDQVSLHGSTVDRLKGADALRRCTIGSDQLVPLALPILEARGITVDDDPPDLVE